MCRGVLGVAGAIVLAAESMPQAGEAASVGAPPKSPVIVCAKNGFAYLDRAYDVLRRGGDTLDAAIMVVTGPEDDPNDDTVGLGGLPSEDGVVELDASCMHGPTRRARWARCATSATFPAWRAR